MHSGQDFFLISSYIGYEYRITLFHCSCDVIEDMHPSSLISQSHLDQPTKSS